MFSMRRRDTWGCATLPLLIEALNNRHISAKVMTLYLCLHQRERGAAHMLGCRGADLKSLGICL